jgi:hypothetical protein
MTKAWPFDPGLNDQVAEIAWQIRELTPDSPTIDKLKALVPLAPILAKLSNLEASVLMEELRERLKLSAAGLTGLKADIKTARKSQEKKKKKEKKGKASSSDIKDLKESFRLHSAIDFQDDFMSIGFRVNLPEKGTGLLLLISDGKGVRAELTPETVTIGERVYQIIQNTVPQFIQGVWNLDRLKDFLEHPSRPQELYRALVEAFKEYLDLPEPAYGLLAAWAVGTYFAHLFAAFPYLHFHGPKQSGKSKSLEALKLTSFNAWKGRDITAAALADTMDGQRGTVCIDQAEKLNSDKENGNLIGLLADSYKKAGGQRRVVEITKAGRSVLEFSAYGPKAFASTKNLDPDLTDRCVRIAMIKTRKKLPDLEGWEPVWGELRDKLYRFTLTAFKEVEAHYKANPGDGTRIRELWRPLLTVLVALEVEEAEIEAVRACFMEAAEEGRAEPDPWESILFEVLKERAESETSNFEMTAEEVLKAMDIEGEHKPGVKWAGNTLSKFSLFSKRLPRKYTEDRRHKVQPYLFIPSHVLKMYGTYMRDTPQNERSQASQSDNSNDSDDFHGTRGNSGTCPKASQDKEGLGRNGTRTEEGEGPIKSNGIIDEPDLGRMGREKSADPSGENLDFLSGEELEL